MSHVIVHPIFHRFLPMPPTLLTQPLIMRFRRMQWLGVAVIALVLSVACSSPDLSGPATEDLTQLPWEMSVSAHAVTLDTMPPYDTLQLTAVARTITGAPLSDTATITFTSSDSSVRVSPTGLLTARRVANGIKIFASTVYHGIRITDSAIVNVTGIANPGAQRLKELHLSPAGGPSDTTIAAPNSQVILFDASKSIQITALDATDTPIPNALVAVQTSDPMQGWFATGIETGVPATTTTSGSVSVTVPQSAHVDRSFTLYAGATIYGMTTQDSLRITVTPPLLIFYSMTKTTPTGNASPVYTLLPHPTMTLSAGGLVFWVNNTASATDSLDIVFDDPVAATADPYFFDNGNGNIDPFPGGDFAKDADFTIFSRTRQFLQPGTVHWSSSKTGLSGTIIVQ
jgi:hypothetical protein